MTFSMEVEPSVETVPLSSVLGASLGAASSLLPQPASIPSAKTAVNVMVAILFIFVLLLISFDF